MARNDGNFISEIYWTMDEAFSFQKVGYFYNLYDKESGYSFCKEFRSFEAMQDYINKRREENAKKEK